MSQLKITEMSTASSVNLSDYVPIVQEGINKKVSVEALVGDEVNRVNAENKRVQAEASRVAAEKSRVQFEEQRKRDENIRIENYESIIALKTEVEQKLQNGDFVGEQGPKGEKGDPGEKGEPGDVTEEYRNLASQIAQNASDAQTSATNAQTSASNAQKAFNDTKDFANQTKTELNQIKSDTSVLKEEANTSATNAKASETKAKEYADNLQASTDDISKLKEDLVNLDCGENYINDYSITYKEAISSNGTVASNDARARSTKAILVKKGTKFTVIDGVHQFNLCFFNSETVSNATFISTPNQYMTEYEVQNDNYVGFTIRKADNTTIDNFVLNDVMTIRFSNPIIVKNKNIENGSITKDKLAFEIKKPITKNYVHISFDDIVRCFEDLATNKDTYNSIYDSEFFGGLKNLHDKYGAKFSLYCYDISSYVSTIGNKFADDFNNASDWLKFGFHLYSQGKNLAGYNAFLNDIFTLGMTFNSIDRLPRLDGFGGSLFDILAMRDTDCGIIGLLTTDDSRSSYYLNDEQNAYLRTHSKLYDYENGLVMYSTNMRLDWFINGFSSDYEYNVPHESNPYDELTYRMKDRTFCNIYEPIVVFIHEWQVFTTSFTINSYFNLIEQVCKFANDYKLDFDYPYIRENFGITKSSLSVASTNGVHTKTELSFDWVMGAIDGTGGLVDSSTRIRTPIFKATKLFVEIPSGYKCNIGKYTSEDAKKSTLENLTGWVTANQLLSDGYFVIAFAQTDDTASVEIGDLLKVVVIN